MTSKKITHTAICHKCNGNGYIRWHQNLIQLWNWGFGYSRVKDCETCNSQGEIIYDEPKMVQDNNVMYGIKHNGCPHN
jgi:DnaJ-class molecular chaperone